MFNIYRQIRKSNVDVTHQVSAAERTLQVRGNEERMYRIQRQITRPGVCLFFLEASRERK